jgi:hypothetical protein
MKAADSLAVDARKIVGGEEQEMGVLAVVSRRRVVNSLALSHRGSGTSACARIASPANFGSSITPDIERSEPYARRRTPAPLAAHHA